MPAIGSGSVTDKVSVELSIHKLFISECNEDIYLLTVVPQLLCSRFCCLQMPLTVG